MHIDTEPRVIAVWAEPDDPQTVDVFTGGGYAGWHNLNCLTGAYPWPTRFYGVTNDGNLIDLDHVIEVGPYDADDYAYVTHTWTVTDTSDPYAVGGARRDGRA